MFTVRKDQIDLTADAGTAEVKLYPIPDTKVFLMDTPGFDDTNFSDAKILESISKALVDAFYDRVVIQGALYIHPVTEAKMRGSGRKNLNMFNKVLGERGMAHCRLVTSKWSLQPEDVSNARVRELCERREFWKLLLDAGAKTVRFNDSMSSAIEIIKPLLQDDDFQPLLLDEVVNKKKPLSQTQAGQVVNDDIEEFKKASQAEIAEIRAEEAKARKAKDHDHAEQLRAEREEHETKINQLEEDRKVLEQTLADRKSGGFGKWIARGTAAALGTAATMIGGAALAVPAALLYLSTEAAIQSIKKVPN